MTVLLAIIATVAIVMAYNYRAESQRQAAAVEELRGTLARINIMAQLFQAILVKHGGPKRAAKEIYFALSHNNDDEMSEIWTNLKQGYGIPRGNNWYDNIDLVEQRLEEDLRALKPRVERIYADWHEQDRRIKEWDD